MKRIAITKTSRKRELPALDLRSPSGRPMTF